MKNDAVARIARSMNQDMWKRMLSKVYFKKMVDGIDIGKICADWHFDVMMCFDIDFEMQQKLIDCITMAYMDGTDINVAMQTPSFNAWLNTFGGEL